MARPAPACQSDAFKGLDPMSHGPGAAQRRLLDALERAEAPLTFGDLARAVLGERRVIRVRSRRRFEVTVPNGDVSNLRRGLQGLIRQGRVVPIVDPAANEPRRTRCSARYALSDRFTFHKNFVPAAPSALWPHLGKAASGVTAGESVTLARCGEAPEQQSRVQSRSPHHSVGEELGVRKRAGENGS
jgi:hypothetical protein